jgi:Protein of unknown function (DUF3485)
MTQIQDAKPSSGGPQKEQIGFGLARAIWITLAIVVVTQLPGFALHSSFVASSVRPLQRSLADLPLVLGNWTGKDSEVDPRIFAAVGAEQQINRVYSNPAGAAITTHCATWTRLNPGMPHGPQECYHSAGWKLAQSQSRTLPDRPDVTVIVDKYERAGQQVVAVYWYQMDKSAFIDREGLRRVRLQRWGQREWPPVSKVLLQAEGMDDAESRLMEFASGIYDFICKV